MRKRQRLVLVTKRSDMVGRSMLGWLFLGPIGAIIGAVSAPSKTYQVIEEDICGAKPRRLERKVGFFLFLGILFIPWVFCLLLLRRGHSRSARIIGFSYIALLTMALAL